MKSFGCVGAACVTDSQHVKSGYSSVHICGVQVILVCKHLCCLWCPSYYSVYAVRSSWLTHHLVMGRCVYKNVLVGEVLHLFRLSSCQQQLVCLLVFVFFHSCYTLRSLSLEYVTIDSDKLLHG